MDRTSYAMILKLLLVLFLSGVVFGDYFEMKCKTTEDKHFSVEPAARGVETGRYIVRWCTKNGSAVIVWRLTVFIGTPKKIITEKNCTKSLDYQAGDLIHSFVEQKIVSPPNCSEVCFSREISRIYTHCYKIQSKAETPMAVLREDDIVYLKSDVTKKEFDDYKIISNGFQDKENVTVTWHSRLLPIAEFSVHLQKCSTDCKNSCNIDSQPIGKEKTNEVINQYCVLDNSDTDLTCNVDMALFNWTNGTYYAMLVHTAPWSNGQLLPNGIDSFNSQPFCFVNGTNHGDPGPSVFPKWMVPTIAVAVLLFVVVAVLLWAQRAWPRKPRNFAFILPKNKEKSVEVARHNSILLVYARENKLYNDMMVQFGRLLSIATGIEVIDIYSEDTCSEMAASPDRFLREKFSQSYVVVMLSRALTYVDSSEQVFYYSPLAADSHLKLLLTILRQQAHLPFNSPYRQFYKCSLSSFPAKPQDLAILGEVNPYTLYELPDKFYTLVSDLNPRNKYTRNLSSSSEVSLVDSQCEEDVVQEKLLKFKMAAEKFADYARTNPDYLNEVFMRIS